MSTKITRKCTTCAARVEPSFRDTWNDSTTWIWPECDTCGEIVCLKCSDANDEGYRECFDCYQTIAWRAIN